MPSVMRFHSIVPALALLVATAVGAQPVTKSATRTVPAAAKGRPPNVSRVPVAEVPSPNLFVGSLRLPAPVLSEQPMILEVVDDLNKPVMGVRVAVKPDTGCGTVLGADTAKTDARGRVTLTWKMGTRAGVCSATTRVVGSKRFPKVITVVTTSGDVGSIRLVRGANQTAAFGSILPDFFEVEVRDKFGNIARNARIRFTVKSGGGRLVDYAAVPALNRSTNLKGLARVVWRLGPGGPQQLEVRALDSPDAPTLLIDATGRP